MTVGAPGIPVEWVISHDIYQPYRYIFLPGMFEFEKRFASIIDQAGCGV